MINIEVLILDEHFISLFLIDTFESLIWTERYNGAGNFEIYTPINDDLLLIMNTINGKREKSVDSYAWIKESEQVMIIEDSQIVTEIETGGYMIISGRSLESLLERRIIWNRTILDGNFQNAVKKLLNENVISPSISDRKIENFIFEASTDKVVTDLTIRAQYTGDNLYDTLIAMCKLYSIGFKVLLNDKNQFVFKLYAGADRSYDQTKNPYVIFSPKFENIIDSNYLESSKTLKNVALVAGEDEGTTRKTITIGSGKGLSRRELYVDARDIQSETSEGTLTPAEYEAQLRQRGEEKLSDNQYTKTFESQVETTQTFIYGQDFFKGDVVQIVTEYGMEAKVRIMEFVRAQDTTGYNTYPTFEVVA